MIWAPSSKNNTIALESVQYWDGSWTAVYFFNNSHATDIASAIGFFAACVCWTDNCQF